MQLQRLDEINAKRTALAQTAVNVMVYAAIEPLEYRLSFSGRNSRAGVQHFDPCAAFMTDGLEDDLTAMRCELDRIAQSGS